MRITGRVRRDLLLVALVLLPALGAVYFALAGIGDLPGVESILGTILVLDTLLGAGLYLSQGGSAENGVYDGRIDVQKVDDKTVMQMVFEDEEALMALSAKKVVRFKVNEVS